MAVNAPAKLAAVLLVFAGAYAGSELLTYPDRPQQGPLEPQTVTIPRGSSLPRIATLLTEAGVVERPLWFRAYVRWAGGARQMRAGRYELSGRLSPAALRAKLVQGPQDRGVAVTVVPGKHGLEIAERLAAAGIVSKADFIQAFRSKELRDKYGVGAPNLEGRLYPDTYRFRPNTPVEEVIDTMVSRHRAVLQELKAQYPAGLARLTGAGLGFDDDDIVALASIVEKETGAASERARVAGVFINRLERDDFQPKLLQTDPTIRYGCVVPVDRSKACRSFEGRIRTVHLRDPDNPYNTYTHQGMPPGPIASPGRAALEAVFAPEAHRYVYFVARNDGTHAFSDSLAQHNRMVAKYQLR